MKRQRRGFTLLGFIVALLLFGIAMSGLFPLVVMYSRVLESLEQRPKQLAFDRLAYREANSSEWYQVPATPAMPNSGEWVHKWYLVPSSDSASMASDAWARKLGASASVKYKSPTSTYGWSLTEPTTATDIDPPGVDAGDATNYAESPNTGEHLWAEVADANAYNSNQRRSPLDATDTPTATWTLSVSTPGWYQVQATGLVSQGPLPTGCNYKLSSDLGVTWGDPITPTNLTFGTSSTWQPLTTKYFSAGTVTVQLTTDTSGTAIADGMRLVRCSVQIKFLTPPTTETATASVEIKPAMRLPP